MPDSRLKRTRESYDRTDPIQRIAVLYLKHAKGLISMGQMADAQKAIEEAARILDPFAGVIADLPIGHIGEKVDWAGVFTPEITAKLRESAKGMFNPSAELVAVMERARRAPISDDWFID